jgi:hypothetical protein
MYMIRGFISITPPLAPPAQPCRIIAVAAELYPNLPVAARTSPTIVPPGTRRAPMTETVSHKPETVSSIFISPQPGFGFDSY